MKAELEQRLQEIDLLKEQAQRQGLAFAAPTKEQLEKKIRGGGPANSPYLYGSTWNSGVLLGTSVSYQVWIANPDPTYYGALFVTLFFGLGNFFDNIADAVIARDTRWPYLSSREFSLVSGGTTTQAFSFATPTTVPRSTYLGNAVLWRPEFLDKGSYFDRAFFHITLT
ncbi:MAG TPA: hypothetical protein VF066_17170 [Thermoleophilaceae bacterium]